MLYEQNFIRQRKRISSSQDVEICVCVTLAWLLPSLGVRDPGTCKAQLAPPCEINWIRQMKSAILQKSIYSTKF